MELKNAAEGCTGYVARVQTNIRNGLCQRNLCQNISESINGTQASNVCKGTRHGVPSRQMAFRTGTIRPQTIQNGTSLEISSTVHFPPTSL